MPIFSDLTQVMQNARTDAKTLDEYVHGAADTQVTSRLGKRYWTLATLDNKLSLVKIKAEKTLADIDTLAKSATDSITAKSNSANTTIDNKAAQANSDIAAKVVTANTAIDSKVAAIDARADNEIANLQSAINTAAAAGAGANGWADTLIAVSENINQRQINDGLTNVSQLASIKNPRNNMRVFVNSYYEGLGVGGGWFYFVKGSTETPIQGLIVTGQGGVWKRETKPFYLVEDFGCHESKDATTNSIALSICSANVKNIVAVKTYNVDVLSYPLTLTNNSILIGGGTFVGQDADILNADNRGSIITIKDASNIKVADINLKNGYLGHGINVIHSQDITVDNVVVDGFTIGIWVGENQDIVKGSKGVFLNNIRVLNTRYWGVYCRGQNDANHQWITNDADMTQDIVCTNSYFYNCHGAGFVSSEGIVKGGVLENIVFEDCNIAIHFEATSHFKVNNIVTKNTGKKPTHLESLEYGLRNSSVYQTTSNNITYMNCDFDKGIYVGCNDYATAFDCTFDNVKCTNITFEAYPTSSTYTPDTNKNYFKNFKINRCTFTGLGLYYQANSAINHWLRDFKITNCMFLDGEGQADTGNRIAMNFSKFVDLEVSNNNFKNTSVLLTGEGSLKFKDNIFKNTDGRSLQFDGAGGTIGGGSYLELTGNTFEKVGAAFTEAAIYINNWTAARVDNMARCHQTAVCYKFTNNYRVEIGGGLVFDTTSNIPFTESNTSSLIYLYHKTA